jgi:hypothetical protein
VEKTLRRALILGLILLLAVAAATWAGFRLAGHIAPERLRTRAELRLSDLLHTPVRVDRTRLSLRWGLILEASGVELQPAGPGSLLRVERASARFDPLALLMLRFRYDRISLEGARLTIEGAPRSVEREGGKSLRDAIHIFDGAARALLEVSPSIHTVELQNGAILFPGSTLEEGSAVRIEGVSGLARRPSFGRTAELRIQGNIRGKEGEAGSIQLRAEVDRTVRASLGIESMDLGILAPYAPPLGVGPDLSGVMKGSLDWRYQPGKPQSLTVRLEGRALHASVLRSGDQSPLSIAREVSTLAARIEAGPHALLLREGEISDGRLTLHAEGSLALPVEERSALRLALRLEELPLPRIREALAPLPQEIREWLDPLSERLEAGRLLDLRAETRTTVGGFRELARTRMLGRPGEITLRLELADARLRIGEGDERLEGLSGTAIWGGEAFELHELRGRLGKRALPRLDLTVSGLSQIRSPDEVNCIAPSSRVSLPGFARLRRWIQARRGESAEPSWRRLTVEADWVRHPALLCSVEHASGGITPAPDGLDFSLQQGVWAGIPIRAEGSYRRAPEESLRLEVALGPPFESMRLEAAADPWAKGDWEFETSRLGRWRTRGASGSFQLAGSALRLEKSTLLLSPLGELEGDVEIALGSEQELPFRIEAQVQKMDLADLIASSGREEELLSGPLTGAAVVTGRLREGLPLLGDAEGVITLHAREGKIHQQVPVFVAIAVASDRFDPFLYGDEIPYTAIDLVGRIEGGQLQSELLTLDAPSLGMAVSGRVGLVSPHELEAVLGLFFFPTLDSLIDRVPVLNRVILGRDKNLMGAYFAMTGTWSEPKAQLIPVKLLSEGPAHFVLEAPGFVWSGLKRLESLLGPASGAATGAEEAKPGP